MERELLAFISVTYRKGMGIGDIIPVLGGKYITGISVKK
jgi:hypothetical protein